MQREFIFSTRENSICDNELDIFLYCVISFSGLFFSASLADLCLFGRTALPILVLCFIYVICHFAYDKLNTTRSLLARYNTTGLTYTYKSKSCLFVLNEKKSIFLVLSLEKG